MSIAKTCFLSLWFAAISAYGLEDTQTKTNKPSPGTAITVYNQDFAVIRQRIPVHLKPGENQIHFNDVTEQVEPESVILRDINDAHPMQILEQNYRFETASQPLLLSQVEGKTIDFQVQHQDSSETVPGKIIRSGFMDRASLLRRYGPQYYYNQASQQNSLWAEQPLIEVKGKLQFSLPGTPLFPALPDDTLLKPSFNWKIDSPHGDDFDAELSYVTGGMVWQADYNVVAPKDGDKLALLGWVTIDNHTGMNFDNANVKLMAGDVSKLKPSSAPSPIMGAAVAGGFERLGVPPVTERTFADYHLYSLPRPVSLKNRETKQVEFLRTSKVPAKRIYVYDGFRLDPQYQNQNLNYLAQDRNFGASPGNPHVWVMEEFRNSKENNLGMPLPKGRMRFYRRDDDGQLEFIGENNIDHTAKDELVRVYTGDAFDITGERKRSNFRIDSMRESAEESFEIRVRNHKKEAVPVSVVEHMYRGFTWQITSNSTNFEKKDSQSIEFKLDIPADGEQKVLYTVHYSW